MCESIAPHPLPVVEVPGQAERRDGGEGRMGEAPLQVQGDGDWYGRFMAADVLYKDREGRVQLLEAEVRKQMEAYGRLQLELGEEHAMRRMTEQQYAS